MSDETAFAIALAERVCPEEVDLAPDIFEAACKGGAEWKSAIEKRTGPVFGGVVDMHIAANFPIVVDAIRNCPYLWSIMGVCKAGKDVLELPVGLGILALHLHEIIKTAIDRRRGLVAEPPVESNIFQPIAEALDRLYTLLQERSIDAAHAESISAEVLKALVEKPDEARSFLDALAKD